MKLTDIITESKSFDEFAEKRMGGATKIANNAKEKGGPSMLTYHHFAVKLPYYKEASEGKFDMERYIINQLNRMKLGEVVPHADHTDATGKYRQEFFEKFKA